MFVGSLNQRARPINPLLKSFTEEYLFSLCPIWLKSVSIECPWIENSVTFTIFSKVIVSWCMYIYMHCSSCYENILSPLVMLVLNFMQWHIYFRIEGVQWPLTSYLDHRTRLKKKPSLFPSLVQFDRNFFHKIFSSSKALMYLKSDKYQIYFLILSTEDQNTLGAFLKSCLSWCEQTRM